MNPSEILRHCRSWRRALVAAALSLAPAGGAGVADPATADGGQEVGPQRYADVLGGEGGADTGAVGFQRQVGGVVVTFDSAETDALVAAGWQPSAPIAGGDFSSLGERVTTFVAIAEALGLDPVIGAQQANWGTPQENGLSGHASSVSAVRYSRDVARYDIVELERHREDAEAVLAGMRAGITAGEPAPGDGAEDFTATIAGLEAEIANVDGQLAERHARIEALEMELAELERALVADTDRPNGEMLPAGWAEANLDVNGDGTVNQADLDAALAAAALSAEQPSDEGGTVAE